MRFTPKHQIGQLILKGKGVEIDDEAMQEIAKLEQLRFLWLDNEEPIGRQVQHLKNLNLRTLRINGITDDGLSQVPDLNVGHLDINSTKHFTEKGFEYIKGRRLRVEVGNRIISGR